MPVVGLAQVLVEPVFTGSQRKISQEFGPAAKKAGVDSGREFGDGMASAIAAKTPEIEAAVAKSAKAVVAAEEKVSAARQKAKAAAEAEATALRNVRVAEERLHEAFNKGTAQKSQLIQLESRLHTARQAVENATNRNAVAQDKLTESTADLNGAQVEAGKHNEKLQRHLRDVAVEVENNSTAWGRFSNSVRSAVRGRPMDEWVRTVGADSKRIATEMDNLAVSVEHSGTRGGRAFTRAFGVVGVTLAAVTPVAGAAGAGLLGAAAAATTLASDLQKLGGVAALIPAGLVAVGTAGGVLRAAFSGVGDAMKEVLEVDDRMATMGQNPRLAAMAIEDAMMSIQVAEENAAQVSENSARRIQDAQESLADAVDDAADQREAAAERIAKAQQRLADVMESAAEAQEQAARRVQDAVEAAAAAQERAAESLERAQRREADAIKDVTRAQRELTKAREEAMAKVKAIKRDMDDANRKTVETAANYKEAVRLYNEARERPGTSALEMTGLQNAVLHAKAADEDARQSVKDLAAEHKAANEELKAGNEKVVRAEERLEDARQRQADAQKDIIDARKDAVKAAEKGARDLADAEKAQAKTARDSARNIVEAQEAIAEAHEDAADAAEEGAERIADAQQAVEDASEDARQAQVDANRAVEQAHRSLERVQLQQADSAEQASERSVLAMSKLTPAAQEAVRALLNVYDQLGKIRDIAQENFFKGFAGPLLSLAGAIMPQLATGVGATATALGGGAQQLMKSLEAGLSGGVLEGLLLKVADSINILNGAIDPIVQSFITLATVGMEYMPRLATYIEELATQFNTFIQGAAADGSLDTWIEAGIQGFKDIGSIISSTMGIFSAWNEAARAAGIDVTLGGVADAMNRIETAMQGEVFQGTMTTILEGAAAGSRGLAEGLSMIGDAFVKGAPHFAEFLRLGGEITGLFVGELANALADPNFGSGLTTFLEGVKQGVQDMGPLMPGLTNAFGDILEQLGPLARELGPTLVEVFTGFANVVSFLLTVLEPLLEWFFSSPVAMGLVIGAFVATAGASAALTAAANLQKVATAALMVVTKGFAIAQGAASIVMGLFTSATGIGTRAIVGNTIAMRAHRIGTAIWTTVTKLASGAMKGLNAVMRANPILGIIGIVTLLVGALVWFFTETEIGRKIIATAWEWIQGAIKNVVDWFQNTVVPHFQVAMGVLQLLFKYLYTQYVKPYIDLVHDIIHNLVDWWQNDIVKDFQDTNRVLGAVFRALYEEYIKPPLDFIMDAAANLISFFVKDVPKGFEDACDGIRDAWNRLRDIAREPVRFVVNRVINDGLIATFNKIPGVDIPDVKLPKGFARGGILDGYQPMKKDDILTPMRRGEGVLVPEAVRGVGPKFIHMLNAAGNSGGVQAVRKMFGSLLHEGRARGGLIHPLPGYPLTSGYGFRGGFNTPGNFHDGYDFGAPTGTPIKAAGSGLVEQAGWGGMAGNFVKLQHAGGLETLYYHMNSLAVRMGQQIAAGQKIGTVGNTGNSFGSHLHYLIRRDGMHVNPGPYLDGGGALGTGKGSADKPKPVENPFSGLITSMMDKLKDKFPQGGMIIDAVGGLVKSGIEKVTSWVSDIKNGIKKMAGEIVGNIKNFFGIAHGGAKAPDEGMLYRDNGGILPPGISQVLNNTGQNEYVLNPQQWRDIHHLATARFEAAERGGDVWNVELPPRATVDDLVDAVGFQQRRNARGGARRG